MLYWILFVLSLAKGLNACSPVTQHVQSVYCQSQFVFQGLLTEFNITSEYSIYRVLVTANVKGKIRSSSGQYINVFSFGYMNSCSPPSATVNKQYVFLVNINRETYRPMIQQLSPMSFVYRKYRQRFDCSCKIDVNMVGYPEIINQVSRGDKCVLDGNNTCERLNGHCGRSQRGTCQWIPSAC